MELVRIARRKSIRGLCECEKKLIKWWQRKRFFFMLNLIGKCKVETLIYKGRVVSQTSNMSFFFTLVLLMLLGKIYQFCMP